MPDVVKGVLDERGGTVKAGIDGDALAIKERLHVLEHGLETLGHFHRIGAVLAGHREQNAGASLYQLIAELRLRALDDVRDVPQAHGLRRMMRHRDVANLAWCQ